MNQNICVQNYKQNNHANVLEFFEEVFTQVGNVLDLLGKDFDIRYIDDVYVKNSGVFFTATVSTKVVGTIGVRKFSDEIAELKRFYLLTEFRGQGIGKKLCEIAFEEAKRLGYKTLRLDTSFKSIAAIKIFRDYGFVEIEKYNDDPYAELYMEKVL